MLPLIQWTGGKIRILPTLTDNLPLFVKQGDPYVFVEPFFGGGALGFHLLQNTNPKVSTPASTHADTLFYFCDVQYPVINFYKELVKNPKKVQFFYTKMLMNYNAYHLNGTDNDYHKRKEIYLDIRSRFNALAVKMPIFEADGKTDFEKGLDFLSDDEKVAYASYFAFLQKVCFNGNFRQNRKGEMNTPFGKDVNANQNFNEWFALYQLCQKRQVNWYCGDVFSFVYLHLNDLMKQASLRNNQVLWYFDPPYYSSDKNYAYNPFGVAQQKQLAKLLQQLDKLGHLFILSNGYGLDNKPLVDLYKGFDIQGIDIYNTISASKDYRYVAQELLVKNFWL